jgi:hypothetical protein
MSFNPNIPRPTDLLSNSQADLLSNNTSLNTTFSKNHIPLNVATNNGKHTFVEMVNSSGLPAGLVVNEGTLYTRSASSISNLYYTPDNSGNQYQLTRTNSAKFSTFATNTAYGGGDIVSGGWTFLPGGMLFQYGVVNIQNSPGLTAVTYPLAFTNPAFMIQATAIVASSSGGDQTASIRINMGTTTGFNIGSTSSGNVTGFSWMAIGV